MRARLLIGLKGEIHLFGDVTDSDAEALASAHTAIRCNARDQFLNTLEHAIQPADCLWVDPTQGPQCGRQMAETVGGGALTNRSPITDLKARKNDTELTQAPPHSPDNQRLVSLFLCAIEHHQYLQDECRQSHLQADSALCHLLG